MTKAGWGFVIAGGVIYLVASQTQIGWLYLFDAIIWSLLVLSALLPWYSLKSLQVERQLMLSPPVLSPLQLSGPREDEMVEVRLKIANHGRIARYFIEVLEHCPFDEPEKRRRAFLVTSLKAGSVTAFSYTATGYRRGYYASASTILQSSGPLGLMVQRRTFQLPLNLTVYPAYYPVAELPGADATWADWGHTIKSRAAQEFYGSREYQPGEPLKHIHWRNTARLQRFMLKEFEQASQGSIAVAFETRHNSGKGRDTTLEYSIKIGASLSRLCADSGRNIDILAGGTPLYHASWREAMDYLARLEEGGKDTLVELTVAAEPGQIVVVIVPTVEAGLIPTLGQLAERLGRLVVVLLEGFTPYEIPYEFTSRLKGSNLSMLHCPRGNLETAIRKLGSSLLAASQLPASVR